jgi:hypothetical protein
MEGGADVGEELAALADEEQATTEQCRRHPHVLSLETSTFAHLLT